MPNICITSVCNRACPYCFAMESAQTAGNHQHMTLDDVRTVLAFLKKSDWKTFSILGGEPTTHPQFHDIVSLALDEGFRLFLFTNALMSSQTASFLGAIPTDKLGVLINVNTPDTYSPKQTEQVEFALAQFSSKASVGFNVFQTDFDLTFLLSLIDRHHLQKRIRIGLTQPIIGGHNAYIKLADYSKIAQRLVAQAEMCDQQNVRLGFDCGFPLCVFTDEQLGKLTRWQAELSFECKPVIDIGPNLDCWACYPLSSWKRVRIADFENVAALTQYFDQQQLLYHRSGIFKQCFDCRYIMREQCKGGCISHVISGYERSQPTQSNLVS